MAWERGTETGITFHRLRVIWAQPILMLNQQIPQPEVAGISQLRWKELRTQYGIGRVVWV